MRIIQIYENEPLNLDDNDILELSKIKSKESQLPFDIIEGKFVTDSYIIGEVQLSNTRIQIKPRHDALSLSSFFEMLLYINNLSSTGLMSTSHSYADTFGVDALLKNFIEVCDKLVSFGLTGTFDLDINKSFKPSGKIKFNNYKKQLLPIEGLVVENSKYQLDSTLNQIIKAALIKICSIKSLSKESSFRIKTLNMHFQGVGDYNLHEDKLREDLNNAFSPNPFYPICLEYASKILLDFRLGYDNVSDFQWNIFLENSNDIFEKYVRTILERDLDNHVCKWAIPKSFAELSYNGKVGTKSYSPDILIDFKNDSARAVFDAKNKNFEPQNNSISDLVNVSDIYQLDFYANQLDSEICGLVYPSRGSFDPIEIELKGKDRKYFLVSIDMSIDFALRKSTFVKNIEKCLVYT